MNTKKGLPLIALFIGKGQPRKRYAGGICWTEMIKRYPVSDPVLLYLLPGVGKMGKRTLG